MTQNVFAKTLEKSGRLALERCFELLVVLSLLSERKHYWGNYKNRDENRHDCKRRVYAHRLHRNNVHGKERHHCCKRCEARENNRPSSFGNGIDGSLLAVVKFYELCSEETVNVDVICYCHGKGKHYGYHRGAHVQIKPEPTYDSHGYNQGGD